MSVSAWSAEQLKKPIQSSTTKVTNKTEWKTSPLMLNSNYLEKLKTPNIVYNDIYTAYITDFVSRYEKMSKEIKDYDESQDKILKPMNMKIEKIQKDFDPNNENSDFYLDDLVKKEMEQNAFNIKKITKNKFNYEQEQVAKYFSDEDKIFIKIFKSKMSEYTVTDEEKVFLDKSIKETLAIIKTHPLTLDSSVFDKQLADLDKTINNYRNVSNLYQGMLDSNLNKFDKALFDNMYKYSRSNSVYQ